MEGVEGGVIILINIIAQRGHYKKVDDFLLLGIFSWQPVEIEMSGQQEYKV